MRPAISWTSRERASVVSARPRTSSATTAKPRPSSPARDASMAALRARRLVWSEMSATETVISPIAPACFSSMPIAATDLTWRAALALIAAIEVSMKPAASLSCACRVIAWLCDRSARSRDWAKEAAMAVIEASDSCAAPAASSAAVEICCMARCSSSAAEAASVTPPASSWVAAARRSAADCGLAIVLRRLGGGVLTGVGGAGSAALRAPRLFANADVFTSAILVSESRG